MTTIERMSPWEYSLRMEAYRLAEVDRDYLLYRQAWITREVNAKKKVGKKEQLVYRKFSEFYDYKAAEQRARGKKVKKRPSQLGERIIAAMKMQEKRKNAEL